MATGPKLSTNPIEVLTNDGTRKPPFLNKIWGPAVFAVVGFTGVVGANWGAKRPLLSGIQRYILVVSGFAALGKFLDDYRVEYFAERDAVFRHYIELHPEDFPDYKQKKFSEVFEPWLPIR